jgi:hypothetical protein
MKVSSLSSESPLVSGTWREQREERKGRQHDERGEEETRVGRGVTTHEEVGGGKATGTSRSQIKKTLTPRLAALTLWDHSVVMEREKE